MRNENKVRIIVGLSILLVWILYINLIYGGSAIESMDSLRCGINAGTNTCINVYTNFGGMP